MKVKEMLQDRYFKPEKLVLLNESPPESLLKKEEESSSGIKEGVEIIEYNSERMKIITSLPRPKILVLSEAFYPGWKACLDGKEVRIYQANFAFRAVPLPSGMHTVTFVYDPISFKVGKAITVFTLLSFIFLSISYAFRNCRAQNAE
jgi:uncharacterized membrane protein YfhO